jgi:hypothetical protein
MQATPENALTIFPMFLTGIFYHKNEAVFVGLKRFSWD